MGGHCTSVNRWTSGKAANGEQKEDFRSAAGSKTLNPKLGLLNFKSQLALLRLQIRSWSTASTWRACCVAWSTVLLFICLHRGLLRQLIQCRFDKRRETVLGGLSHSLLSPIEFQLPCLPPRKSEPWLGIVSGCSNRVVQNVQIQILSSFVEKYRS